MVTLPSRASGDAADLNYYNGPTTFAPIRWDEWAAASDKLVDAFEKVQRAFVEAFQPVVAQCREWDTRLWDRKAVKPWACQSINTLQGRMRHAGSGRAKTRIELEMLHLSDYVRTAS